MEAVTYHLISCAGIDVVIIPELDCRINVINLTNNQVPEQPYDLILFATIGEWRFAFTVVNYSNADLSALNTVIRWYGYQVIYRNLDLSKQSAPPITITYSTN